MLIVIHHFPSDSSLKWITFVNFCLLVRERLRHGSDLREVSTALEDVLEVFQGQAFGTAEDFTQLHA